MRTKTISILSILFLTVTNMLYAQSSENATMKLIEEINRETDQAILVKDTIAMLRLYASDFVFTHGGGQVDSRASWIKSILPITRVYQYRNHDSTQVELHKNIAIVKGRLSISRKDKEVMTNYGIRYLRVYAFRKKSWQLISHSTTREWKN